jgi:plasmid stabilization system protein ParE
MKFKVRILKRAWSDADAVFDWIAARSPAGASRWYAAFLAAVQGLSRNPLRFAVAPESEALGQEICQAFFRTPHGRVYRLLFVVAGEEVRILRVRALGQSPVTDEELES